MLQYFHNVNAYVEDKDRYGTDSVELKLDETNNQVTVYPVDVYDAVITGASPIVDETFDTFAEAVAYYEEVAHQLAQGDQVRRYNRPGIELSGGYDDNNSRY